MDKDIIAKIIQTIIAASIVFVVGWLFGTEAQLAVLKDRWERHDIYHEDEAVSCAQHRDSVRRSFERLDRRIEDLDSDMERHVENTTKHAHE